MTDGLVIGTHFCTRKLKGSDAYRFQVIAVNKFGESQPGPVSEVIETIGTNHWRVVLIKGPKAFSQ